MSRASTRRAAIGLVVGLALTAGPVAARSVLDAGTPASSAAATSSSPPHEADRAPTDGTTERDTLPTRVRVPALGVEAPIVPVGVTDDGQMAIPSRVSDVGWYRFGPVPGSPSGSSVLAGHLDDGDQGDGALADLEDIRPGDEIDLDVTEAGRAARLPYEVREVRRLEKDQVPTADLFRDTGAPRLVVITCGGPFDRELRRYRDNVVVVASPLAPRPKAQVSGAPTR